MKRTTGLRLCSGQSGMIAMMVEQFGLAMMPSCAAAASGLISGITSGTAGSIRKAEELSTTTAPLFAAAGPSARDVPPPAEKKAMSMPLKTSRRGHLDRDLGAAVGEALAGRAGRGEQLEVGDGKVPLLQAFDHLDPDRAGRADDGHPLRARHLEFSILVPGP